MAKEFKPGHKYVFTKKAYQNSRWGKTIGHRKAG